MSELFLTFLNMSISAGWIVLALLLLRFVLKKLPKWVNVLLWAVVGVRLCLPVTFQSELSLVPSAQTVSPEIMYAAKPEIHTGIYAINSMVNPAFSESFAPDVTASVNPLQVWVFVLSIIWILGVFAMLLYAFVSYFRLRLKMKGAVCVCENIYKSKNTPSAFVLGLFRPKIYLPYSISDNDLTYVVSHEKMHILRGDHFIKPIGFLLLCVYWFNPLLWIAYILLCRDIELACDEKVIKKLNDGERADYSQALLSCSVSQRAVSVCPVAFGEVGVKGRIKNVLSYKKAPFWVLVCAIVLCVAFSVCFLTNPKEDTSVLNYKNIADKVSSIEDILYYEPDGEGVVSGKALGEFLAGENWKQKRNGEAYELAPDVQIVIDEGFSLRFYESEERLAMVVAGGEHRYYTMRSNTYFDVLEFLKNENLLLNQGTDPVWNGPLLSEGAKLTLDDVLLLSKKGKELSFADFEKFAYYETGSGLYIRVYPIDEMFYVSIGSAGYPEITPMYIYLFASDWTGAFVDIREDDVEYFISEHKDNAPVKSVGYGWQLSPVGTNEQIQQKMTEFGGIPRYAYLSSRQSVYAAKIDSKERFSEFENALSLYIVKDYLYEDTVSYNDAVKEYDKAFFEKNDLYICYLTQGNTSNRFRLESANISEEILHLRIQNIDYEFGDLQEEGYFLFIAISKENSGKTKDHYAYISSTDYVSRDTTNAKIVAQYILVGEQNKISKPALTLYDNGVFKMFFSPYSSYIGEGRWEKGNSKIVLKSFDFNFTYTFYSVKNFMSLKYDKSESSDILWGAQLADGAVFESVDVLSYNPDIFISTVQMLGAGNEKYTLSPDDENTLKNIFDRTVRKEGSCDGINDCVIEIYGKSYIYSSSCGCFILPSPGSAPDSLKSFELSENERETVNKTLSKYVTLGIVP